MTKEEMLALLKESAVKDVKKAEDTLENIKCDTPAKKEPELDKTAPTQKDIEKEVHSAEKPLVPADKEGVSKNGGVCDKLMTQDGVEEMKKHQDANMKDIINVTSRKMDENSDVSNELLERLQEASAKEESYQKRIKEISSLCEKALRLQAKQLTEKHAKETYSIFEAVLREGEKLEKQLVADANKNKKLYAAAKRLYESSSKLNSVLLEAVKKSLPEKKMVRYSTPVYRAMNALNK